MHFSGIPSRLAQAKPALLARMARVLDHGQFILGPEVRELEERLALRLGVGGDAMHAVTCASGTDALRLALMALDIGPGHSVLVPAFGFAAAAEAVILSGAIPLFVDIDPITFNIDVEDARKKMAAAQGGVWKGGSRPKPKALIAIDTYGLPADYSVLETFCREFDMHLIEDAAQSLGATCHGRQAGTFGILATTSFYPTKALGGLGDGGALFTRDGDLAKRLFRLRDHGQSHRYHHVEVGVNSRLDTLQAAALLEALPHLDAEVAARRKVARRYGEAHFQTLTAPKEPLGFSSAWSVYTILHPQRDALRSALEEMDIPTACHYPHILPEMPAFKAYARDHSRDHSPSMPESGLGDDAAEKEAFPEAYRVSRQCLSLPIHRGLSEPDLHQVVQALEVLIPELEGQIQPAFTVSKC